jgi:hypothetical protein
MLKWLRWLILPALIATVVLVTRHYKDYDTGPKGYDARCIQENQSSPAAGYVVCSIETSQDAQTGKHQPQWWYKLVSWPEGITAWAILLTLCAICWQSWETRRAAGASNKSVDAALSSIQAFINSERPWIKVDFAPKEEGRYMGIVVRAINCGKTPAALISRNKTCGIYEWGEPSLPGNPTYEPTLFKHPPIVFPGESCTLFLLTLIDDAIGVEENSAEHQRLRDMDVEAFMYGNVVYKDVLGGKDAPAHETRWCYHVLPWRDPEKFLLVENTPRGGIEEEYSYRT